MDENKIEALIINKDKYSIQQFLEVYKRLQAENNVFQSDKNYNEYDICAWISDLAVRDPDPLKLEYIINRTYELWNHVFRMRQAEINHVQSEIKIMSMNL